MSKKTNSGIPKTLKDFLSWYKDKMPDEVYLVKNEERYKEIFNSINTLAEAIQKISPDAEIGISHGELDPSAVYFRVVTDELVSNDIAKLCEALSRGSNIEVYPLAVKKGEDPKLSMSILFNGAFDSAPPQDSPFPEFEKGYSKPAIKKTMK